jgi:hypothetical protein
VHPRIRKAVDVSRDSKNSYTEYLVKKRTTGIILVLVLGFVIFKAFQFLNRIDQADPDYNTIYTDHYKEDLFTKALLGKTEVEIIKTLGEPFSKTKLEYFDAILYTNQNDSIDLNANSNSLTLLGYGDSLIYKFISFDSLGNVKSVMIKGYPETENEIQKLSKSEIIKNFGLPDKEMLCDCNCEVYSYSKIKGGSYSGKQPIINQRNIVFDNKQIAIKIIKKVGNTYSKYDEICNVK